MVYLYFLCICLFLYLVIYLQISVVQYLLSKDADPNDADKSGNTPLHIAARTGFKDVVKALIAAGAKPSSNRAGKSPQQLTPDPDTAAMIEAAGN